jgi:hypothetical protein
MGFKGNAVRRYDQKTSLVSWVISLYPVFFAQTLMTIKKSYIIGIFA